MRARFLLAIPLGLLLSPGTACAQNSSATALSRPEDLKIVLADPNRIYEIVNEPAAPVGGMGAFNDFLLKNITYPASALAAKAHGTDSVEFVVETDGTLTNVALRGAGVHPACDAEALRVVRAAPAWAPAHHRGNVVRQRVVIPVAFAAPLGGPTTAAAPGPAGPKARRNAFTGKPIVEKAAGADLVVTPEKPARYPDGGLPAFQAWLKEHIQYPDEAREKNVEGEVKVEFTIDTDGTLINCKALTQLGYGLEDEALRLLRVCPDWQPAVYHGGPIRSVMTLAIPFVLE